jgi:hypothetical protein
MRESIHQIPRFMRLACSASAPQPYGDSLRHITQPNVIVLFIGDIDAVAVDCLENNSPSSIAAIAISSPDDGYDASIKIYISYLAKHMKTSSRPKIGNEVIPISRLLDIV